MTLLRHIYHCIALLFAITAGDAFAAETSSAVFSKQVTALTGDWEAEDWKKGVMKMHPTKYTWQSDNYLEVILEEPKQGRDPKQVLVEKHGVIQPNKKTFDSQDAEELAAGVWTLMGDWVDTYGDKNFSIWGIVETKADTLITFSSNCQPKQDEAEFKACRDSIIKILALLRDRDLILPEPEFPLSVAYWTANYKNSGVSTLTYSNYSNTVNATIRVSPPLNIPEEKLMSVIEEFSQGSWDSTFDSYEKNPPSHQWVGSTDDPWIRSFFPDELMDGASTIMAGSIKLADGRSVLLSVRCPNESWQSRCSRGVEQSRFWLQSGVVEKRRQKIIAANTEPIPKNGLKNSDVLAIHGTFEVNGITPYFDGNYFLKDGRVYSSTTDAPMMIDPIKSRKDDPGSWGRWQRTGNSMRVSWDDGSTSDIPTSPSNTMVGGAKGMRLTGYYGSISSSGNGITGTGFVNRSGYTFYADGTFTGSSSNMFSVGGFVGDGAMPTQIVSGGGSSKSARSRYEIDGYTIAFFYPDGQVSRRAFALNAADANNPKRETLYIDGSSLTLNGGED